MLQGNCVTKRWGEEGVKYQARKKSSLYNARIFLFFFSTLDELSYHNIADETLDAIAELFEDLGESPSSPTDYDVHLSVS